MSKKVTALNDRIINPRSASSDVKRREFIFLLGAVVYAAAAAGRVIIESSLQRRAYHGVPIWLMLVPLVILLILYAASRQRFRSRYPYIFLLLFVASGTYALWLYGYELPEGLLTYALVVVMAGVMISARAALNFICLIAACLSVLSFLQEHNITHPDVTHRYDALKPPDIVTYILLLGMIGLVSWLFSRDLTRSLERARRSETALLRQRDALESEVRARTRELEQAQVEKMLELQRFAEFGRLSATLLHELANPLTSVSLNLEQLAEDVDRTSLIRHVQKGVASMEQYVAAARRQLRDKSEPKRFSANTEVKKVASLLETKARHHYVKLELQRNDEVMLYGDTVRFHQMLSNLIANAIDAYADSSLTASKRRVLIKTRRQGRWLALTVQDWGTGIPDTELTRIFEPFYTTKGAQRGTGIGLTITKRTVEEEFGGRISVKSTSRLGTRFVVLIPVAS